MLSRDAKRIASRRVIRLATRTAKGGEQRDALLMQTGSQPCNSNTVIRADAVGMAPRGMDCFNRHIGLHVALLINTTGDVSDDFVFGTAYAYAGK